VHYFSLTTNVYNQREKQRNAQSIIAMEGNTTLLFSPDNLTEEPKKFTYDYSYWSHDGFTEAENGLCLADETHENGSKYADQVRFSFKANNVHNNKSKPQH
jgi:hypothetical protein